MGGRLEGNHNSLPIINLQQFNQINLTELEQEIQAQIITSDLDPYIPAEASAPASLDPEIQAALTQAEASGLQGEQELTINNIGFIKQNGKIFYSQSKNGIYYSLDNSHKTYAMNANGKLVQLSEDSTSKLNSKSMFKTNIYASKDGKTVFSFIDGKATEIKPNDQGLYTVLETQWFEDNEPGNSSFGKLQDVKKTYIPGIKSGFIEVSLGADGHLDLGLTRSTSSHTALGEF